MLEGLWGKGNTHLLFVILQTGAATMEISVDNTQKAEGRVTRLHPSLDLVLHRHQLNHDHCCSIYGIENGNLNENMVHIQYGIPFICK